MHAQAGGALATSAALPALWGCPPPTALPPPATRALRACVRACLCCGHERLDDAQPQAQPPVGAVHHHVLNVPALAAPPDELELHHQRGGGDDLALVQVCRREGVSREQGGGGVTCTDCGVRQCHAASVRGCGQRKQAAECRSRLLQGMSCHALPAHLTHPPTHPPTFNDHHLVSACPLLHLFKLGCRAVGKKGGQGSGRRREERKEL